MTNKEKASRYDALQVAIKLTIESLEKEISRCPTAAEVGNNPLMACDFGRSTAYQNVVITLNRWLA